VIGVVCGGNGRNGPPSGAVVAGGVTAGGVVVCGVVVCGVVAGGVVVAPVPGVIVVPLPGAVVAPVPGAVVVPLPGAVVAPVPGVTRMPAPGTIVVRPSGVVDVPVPVGAAGVVTVLPSGVTVVVPGVCGVAFVCGVAAPVDGDTGYAFSGASADAAASAADGVVISGEGYWTESDEEPVPVSTPGCFAVSGDPPELGKLCVLCALPDEPVLFPPRSGCSE